MKTMLRAVIKKHIKLLISVTLIASLGFSLSWGLSGGYVSLERSLRDYVEKYHYPDVCITTEITTSDDADSLLAIDGVQGCDTRLFADTLMKTSDEDYFSVRVFSYTDSERQTFCRWSESDGGDGVLIEYNFAENNGISAGDTVSFRVRDEYRDYTVSAVISRPETLSAKVSDNAWGLNYDFGYIYAPAVLLAEEFEKDYRDNKAQLDEKSDELSAQKNSAQKLLDEKEDQLMQAKKLLSEMREEYLSSSVEAESAIEELNKTKDELLSSEQELEEKKAELAAAYETAASTVEELSSKLDLLTRAKEGLDEINAAEKELKSAGDRLRSDSVQRLISLLSDLPDSAKMSELISGAEELSDYLDQMDKIGFHYDLSAPIGFLEKTLNDFEAQMDADYAYLSSHKVEAMIASSEAFSPTDAGYSELNAVLRRYSAVSVTDAASLKSAYQTALSRLTALRDRARRPSIRQTLDLLKSIETDRSAKELLDSVLSAENELRGLSEGASLEQMTAKDVKQLYTQALEQTDEALDTLSESRGSVVKELSANGIGESDLPGTLTQLSDGIASARSAYAELKDASVELDEDITDIKDGIAEIDDGISEIEGKLSDGQSQLNSVENEIAGGESKLSESAKEMRVFTDLEDELERAYKKLGDSEGYDRLCNQFLLYLEDDADADRVLEQARAALSDSAVKSGYTYRQSPVKKRIDNNLNPMSAMMSMLPAIFFGIVLIVVFLFMSMIIRQSRRDIGILMALGIGKASVRGMFCVVAAGVALGGIILGSGIGLAVRGYVGGYFKSFFPLPEFTYLPDIGGFAVGALATFGVCVTATLIGTVMIERITPKEAMSRPVQADISVPAFLNRLLSKASPMLKFNLTSLFRNKGRFLFSTICVSTSVMMIFTSVSFIASKNHVIHQTFDERIRYDCQIFFENDPSDDLLSEIEAIEGVSEAEKVLIYDIAVSSDKGSEQTTVYAIAPENRMIGINSMNGESLAPERGTIIVDRHLADALGGVEVGDSLTVASNRFTVSGMTDQCVNRAQYITQENVSGTGKPELYSVLCRFDGEPRRRLLAFLTEHDDYLYTVFTEALYNINHQLYATYDLAAWILIAFGVLIGFIIVLNTAITNLQDNKRELCVLRTLGFQHTEISRSRFTQSLLQFITACVIGLISGTFLARFTLLRISTPTEEFAYACGVKEALIVSLIVFLYILFSHLAAMRTMKKWNHAEVVKDKE